MSEQTDDLVLQALSLYRLTRDPLVLSAVAVLENPAHPGFDEASELISRLVDAHFVLFGRPLD